MQCKDNRLPTRYLETYLLWQRLDTTFCNIHHDTISLISFCVYVQFKTARNPLSTLHEKDGEIAYKNLILNERRYFKEIIDLQTALYEMSLAE